MDKINKTICIDNSRSHRNGLLPFVRYGGNGERIEVVNGETLGGNYGQYVCDFVLTNKTTNKEICRLKYLDLLRKYNFIQEQLLSAIYLKKKDFKNVVINKIDCEENTILSSSTVVSKWVENFDEIYELLRYQYTPMDSNFFMKSENTYVFEYPFPDEEDDVFIEIRNKLNANDFIVIIPNYDKVMQYNKEWSEWWLTNYGENWENDVFNGYSVNTNISPDFKFCHEFDTYILGKIEVSGIYDGDKIPPYIYMHEIIDRMEWFENNSASTVTAYANPNKENKHIIDIWEDNGGAEFYNFLKSLPLLWQTQKIKNRGDVSFFYKAPILEINTILNNEYDTETVYSPYELSVVADKKESAIQVFEPIPYNDMVYIKNATFADGTSAYVNAYYMKDTVQIVEENGELIYILSDASIKGNGLTPFFMSGLSSMCESKLDTLIHDSALHINNDIFGIYEQYNTNGGQLFKCVYRSGSTTTPRVEVFCSGITHEYRTIDDGNGTKVLSTVRYISTTHIGTIEETYPTTNAYQVCGQEIIGSSITDSVYDYVVISNETEDTKLSYWSANTIINYGWWDCYLYDNSNNSVVCGDGENIKSKDKKYRNITVLSCLKNLVGRSDVGDEYYFLARFKNGLIEPTDIFNGTLVTLGLPYLCNTPINVSTYEEDGTVSYDIVTSITKNLTEGNIKIEYIIGATSGNQEHTGVHYEDVIPCKFNIKENVSMDGAYTADLYYDKIDLEKTLSDVYSSEYRAHRKARLSKITGMEVGSIWTSSAAVKTLLITKESLDGILDEPKTSINLMFNRGNAAGWEKHFKLSECNTMEDLENYGNNFFNI